MVQTTLESLFSFAKIAFKKTPKNKSHLTLYVSEKLSVKTVIVSNLAHKTALTYTLESCSVFHHNLLVNIKPSTFK